MKRAALLVAALLCFEAHADTFEDEELVALFAVGTTISSSTLVFFIANAAQVASGTRRTPWVVGGICSGITATVAGAVEMLFGLALIETGEDGGRLDADELAWLISGGASFLIGSLTITFAAAASRLPRRSSIDWIDRPAGSDSWSIRVAPTVVASRDRMSPSIALIAAW
jgi:hypothetical protein